MLLSALAFAAALQAAPVTGQKGYLIQRRPFEVGQRVDQPRLPFPKRRPMTREELERMRDAGLRERPVQRPKPGFKSQRVAQSLTPSCAAPPLEYTAKREPVLPRKLGDLPRAHGERAVLRTLDGCPVPALVAMREGLPQ